MEDSEKSISKKANLMRNEIVLDIFSTCRLLGWTDQHEEDYYWVILTRKQGIGIRIELVSCVIGFKRLKNVLSEEDYKHLDETWNINNGSVEDGLSLAKEKGIKIK